MENKAEEKNVILNKNKVGKKNRSSLKNHNINKKVETNTRQNKYLKNEPKLEKDIYAELYPNIRRRNYSPDHKDNTVTQRIIQYFEDPKEASALAEIKRLSNKAKRQSSKNVNMNFDDDNDDNILDNTEKNRVMFKDVGNDDIYTNPNVVAPTNNPFLRRKKQFATQKYVHKNNNMNLMD